MTGRRIVQKSLYVDDLAFCCAGPYLWRVATDSTCWGSSVSELMVMESVVPSTVTSITLRMGMRRFMSCDVGLEKRIQLENRNTCVCICMYVYMYVCIYVYMYIYIHKHTHMYTHICVCVEHIHTHMHTHTNMYAHIHVCVCKLRSCDVGLEKVIQLE